jgi:hypothetical protein
LLYTYRRMFIYRLRGSGKTAIALELVYWIIAKYSLFLVLWVLIISREIFEIMYREIRILLHIPGITNNTDIKQFVKNNLNSGDFGDWLIFIDNTNDPSVLLGSTNNNPRVGRLYDYFLCNNRGSILFTTQSRKTAKRLT